VSLSQSIFSFCLSFSLCVFPSLSLCLLRESTILYMTSLFLFSFCRVLY
jgi:hypothetical protein